MPSPIRVIRDIHPGLSAASDELREQYRYALSMPSNNQKLAAIFGQMADILVILDANRFKVNAMARAARVLDDLADDVADIPRGDLSKLPGIGKSIAAHIGEYLDAGEVPDHLELLQSIPDGLLDLLNIPGLGPKTVALFWKQAQIENMDDLRAALEGDGLTQLPGMGKKKIEKIRKNLDFVKKSADRVRIGEAMPLARWFIEQLQQIKGVKQITYGGSLRRGKETIGDVDLLVAANACDNKAISDAFTQLEIVEEIVAQGDTKTSIRTNAQTGHIGADLRIVEPDSFGAALLYFTGSKEHNIQMRERAIRQGMSLNEYALTKQDDAKPVAGKTEEDVFKALGLKWIPPELREARDEIARAENNELPALVTGDDIKAELHAHTTASDGRWSIEELALAAAKRGFHTVAITDHSKGQAQANGLSEERLVAHIEAVRKVAAKMKDTITILAGSEVDILADGRLDYADDLLAQLDVVVASPHAALSQEDDKATARLLKAIENPHVTLLGHPTGRLVLRREGLHPDMKKLIAAAAERGIAMEINANSWRLDLRDTHARAAIEAGVKLAINTDAHGPGDLDELQYGILTARRAGATKNDIVNCMSKTALSKWIQSTKV